MKRVKRIELFALFFSCMVFCSPTQSEAASGKRRSGSVVSIDRRGRSFGNKSNGSDYTSKQGRFARNKGKARQDINSNYGSDSNTVTKVNYTEGKKKKNKKSDKNSKKSNRKDKNNKKRKKS